MNGCSHVHLSDSPCRTELVPSFWCLGWFWQLVLVLFCCVSRCAPAPPPCFQGRCVSQQCFSSVTRSHGGRCAWAGRTRPEFGRAQACLESARRRRDQQCRRRVHRRGSLCFAPPAIRAAGGSASFSPRRISRRSSSFLADAAAGMLGWPMRRCTTSSRQHAPAISMRPWRACAAPTRTAASSP